MGDNRVRWGGVGCGCWRCCLLLMLLLRALYEVALPKRLHAAAELPHTAPPAARRRAGGGGPAGAELHVAVLPLVSWRYCVPVGAVLAQAGACLLRPNPAEWRIRTTFCLTAASTLTCASGTPSCSHPQACPNAACPCLSRPACGPSWKARVRPRHDSRASAGGGHGNGWGSPLSHPLGGTPFHFCFGGRLAVQRLSALGGAEGPVVTSSSRCHMVGKPTALYLLTEYALVLCPTTQSAPGLFVFYCCTPSLSLLFVLGGPRPLSPGVHPSYQFDRPGDPSSLSDVKGCNSSSSRAGGRARPASICRLLAAAAPDHVAAVVARRIGPRGWQREVRSSARLQPPGCCWRAAAELHLGRSKALCALDAVRRSRGWGRVGCCCRPGLESLRRYKRDEGSQTERKA